ncbi:uncharacterized protein LOC134177319 [Corticium candelabrum]|uniref:uncharacterized protein LOC134177319 n=1 Tax=Corticium candelabrum TaxID=121492 RepID=UPI002E255B6F|nr:uncharacterized protein LOC134177319 [Corticium candelabrum]
MSSGCDKQHFVGDFSGELKQCGADIDYCNVRNIEQSAIWIVNRPQSFIQTMCVVIPPQLMLERNSGNTLQPVYVDMIRGFLACGFCPVAMKMIWFSEKEAKELSEMMQVDMKIEVLTSGPSIALALERDNAVVLFDGHINSCRFLKDLYAKYQDIMIIPRSDQKVQHIYCILLVS